MRHPRHPDGGRRASTEFAELSAVRICFTTNGAPTKKVHRPNHLSFHDAGAHRYFAVDREGAPRTFCRRRSERRWPRFPPFVLQAQSQFTRLTAAPRVRQAPPYKAAKSMPPIAVSHSHQLVEQCSGLGFSTQFSTQVFAPPTCRIRRSEAVSKMDRFSDAFGAPLSVHLALSGAMCHR